MACRLTLNIPQKVWWSDVKYNQNNIFQPSVIQCTKNVTFDQWAIIFRGGSKNFPKIWFERFTTKLIFLSHSTIWIINFMWTNTVVVVVVVVVLDVVVVVVVVLDVVVVLNVAYITLKPLVRLKAGFEQSQFEFWVLSRVELSLSFGFKLELEIFSTSSFSTKLEIFLSFF